MAQYDVRHVCGHARTVRLYGPHIERQSRLRYLATIPCPTCLTDVDHDRALTQTETRDLPALVGTPKQIEWAIRCRRHALLLLDRVLADARVQPETIPLPDDLRLPGEANPTLGSLLVALYEQDSARFWIDHGQHAQRAGKDSWLSGFGWLPPDAGVTEVVAGLLFAAAGVTDPPAPHRRAIEALLRPRHDAVMRHATPHSQQLAAHVAGIDNPLAALTMRIDAATALIRRALRGRTRPYIAFSGGKDSTAVLALVLSVRDDVTVAWTDDELEYPETVDLHAAYQRSLGARYVVTLGRSEHAGWFTPWTDTPSWRDPLPGSHRKTIPQDDWMAARGHDVTFLGTRGQESLARGSWFAASGPLYRVAGGTGRRCCPIWDWSTADVWAYLATVDVAVNPVYDRLEAIGISRERQRVGPLPLTPRAILAEGWPELLDRLEARYGERWR